MKKIAAALAIAIAAFSAQALDLGITGSRDYAGTGRNGVGVTVGQSYGKVSATAGVEQFNQGKNNQTRYSLIGGYKVGSVGPVSFGVNGGVAYLENQYAADGFALVVGVGASVPVTNKITATLDVSRQYGQDRVQTLDANKVTAGLKYAF